MKKMVECFGVTDVVAQIREVLNEGGVVDINTVGGTGIGTFDYSFTTREGEQVDCKGRKDFVEAVIACNANISPTTITAGGGRTNYYWFEVDMPEPEEVEETPQEEPELEPEDAMPDASVTAIDLARAHNIDLRDVTPSGKLGKIIKSDVVKHLEKLQ